MIATWPPDGSFSESLTTPQKKKKREFGSYYLAGGGGQEEVDKISVLLAKWIERVEVKLIILC